MMIRRNREIAASNAAAAAATAAAEAATQAAEAVASRSARLAAGARHGAFVTLAFVLLYYAFLLAQATMKRKLREYHTEQGKKFERYSSKDKKMLGWDRTVGNMLEQSMPFLTLFWMSIFFSESGGLQYGYIVAAGWLYVALRSVYPVLWFSGGGGPSGTTPIIWRITFPMYLINVFFAVNVVCATFG